MPIGSLYHLMRNATKKDQLTEEMGVKIARGIAAGMQHLNSEVNILGNFVTECRK